GRAGAAVPHLQVQAGEAGIERRAVLVDPDGDAIDPPARGRLEGLGEADAEAAVDVHTCRSADGDGLEQVGAGTVPAGEGGQRPTLVERLLSAGGSCEEPCGEGEAGDHVSLL